MPAFTLVAHIDTFELAGSLRQKWGLFSKEPGHRILRVRGHAKGSSPDDDRFGGYAAAKGWVELATLGTEIKRIAEAIMPPGIDVGLTFFGTLDAGSFINWTVETEPYFTRWSRAMIPLRTGPGVLFVCGNETASPGPGWLTIVSPRLPHCAINMGDSPCVWLTIDFKRKQTDA